MALYLYQAAYTAESLAAQIREPHDRIEAVRPGLKAMGAKILVGGYPFGDYDVLVIYEAADDTTAASVAMAAGAGGAVGQDHPAAERAGMDRRPAEGGELAIPPGVIAGFLAG